MRPTVRHPATAVIVGLVNNMLGKAHGRTELQFRRLLAAASGDLDVELRLFSPHAGMTLDGDPYRAVSELETSPLDAVIVTGSPPCAEWMTMEPLWHSLSGIVDVVRARGLPTIWSCLAAQAAIFRLDGVHRRHLPRKISGLHQCRAVEAYHPLMAGLPRQWSVPHSRCNDLPINELEVLGYQPIVVSDTAGADTYITERESLFVFFQGHLEYDRETLLLEYKRDVGKFLAGERQDYPDAPTNYFDAEAEGKVLRFREFALRHKIPALMSEFPAVGYADPGLPEWAGVATRIYANWLHYIARDRWLNPISHVSVPCPTLSRTMGDQTAEGALP